MTEDYALASFLRPTEEMVEAAFNATPLPPMRATREHYKAALQAAAKVVSRKMMENMLS